MLAIGQSSLPLTFQNLPPAETLNQIIKNMNVLCNVINETMTVLSKECQMEQQKIDQIKQRVKQCEAKSGLVSQHRDKAITILSKKEYPISESQGFAEQSLKTKIKPPINHDQSNYKLTIKQQLEKPKYEDTLQLSRSISQKTAVKTEDKPEGLGILPQWLTSVSDCLLFNTNQNPYIKYTPHNELDEKKREKKKINESQSQAQRQQQPPTIANKVSLSSHNGLGDLRLQSLSGNAPQLEIASTVPGLSGVALDINFPFSEASNGGACCNDHNINPSLSSFSSSFQTIRFATLPDLLALPRVAFVEQITKPLQSSQQERQREQEQQEQEQEKEKVQEQGREPEQRLSPPSKEIIAEEKAISMPILTVSPFETPVKKDGKAMLWTDIVNFHNSKSANAKSQQKNKIQPKKIQGLSYLEERLQQRYELMRDTDDDNDDNDEHNDDSEWSA